MIRLREHADNTPGPESEQVRKRLAGFSLMNWTDRYAVLRDLEDNAPDAVLREAQAALEEEAKALSDGFRARPVLPQHLHQETPDARRRRDELRQFAWTESAARNLREILGGSADTALSVQPNADTLADSLNATEREAVMRMLGDEDLAALARQARRMRESATRQYGPANGITQRFREATVWGKIGMLWDSEAAPGHVTRLANELSSRSERLRSVEAFAARELEMRGKPLPPEGEHD